MILLVFKRLTTAVEFDSWFLYNKIQQPERNIHLTSYNHPTSSHIQQNLLRALTTTSFKMSAEAKPKITLVSNDNTSIEVGKIPRAVNRYSWLAQPKYWLSINRPRGRGKIDAGQEHDGRSGRSCRRHSSSHSQRKSTIQLQITIDFTRPMLTSHTYLG